MHDKKQLKEYKARTEEDDGELLPELSLLYMMETCVEFSNEVS